MDPLLKQLAEKLGIATKFSDSGLVRKDYEVEESIVKFFAAKLGYKAGNIQEIAKSLDDLDKRRWQNILESVYIVNTNNVRFDVVLPTTEIDTPFHVTLRKQNSSENIDVSIEVTNTNETRQVGRAAYSKLCVKINTPLDIGYYDLTLRYNHRQSKSVLAVCPEKCCETDVLKHGKIWGYTIQLYSLRSERNWGVGDFTDLKEFVKICSRCGANVIGLNPLNVLMHNYPEEASPYQSISRLFLNPIYIDIEAVPEFNKTLKKGLDSKIETLRNSDYIDYTGVYTLKTDMLAKLYEKFKEGKDKSRQEAYEAFCRDNGSELEKLATFQALYDEKTNTTWGGWRAWEEEFQNPSSLGVKNYAKSNADRIGFFKFMQFEADRQFNLAHEEVKKNGLRIGFYRDLAVGVGQDSAELWSDPDLFIKEAGAGAPPDPFFTCGQKWGLGAFNPYVLKEKAYEPFIKILRANMKNAGALRIDHVMSLMRLFVIPESRKCGTYIMYNFADMLNIVALESCLNNCTIVGESIGNVPDGFLARLAEKNIHSLSVLWAERWEMGWGHFKAPQDYPAKAFVSVGTHDMHPLRCWWFGRDIATMRRLGLIETDADLGEAYKKREADRLKLLESLDSCNVWPQDNLRKSNYLYGEGYPEGIEEAVHTLVSRSNSEVFLAELENILHVEKMQNLPGTDRDKYPNWRLKLPVPLERLEQDIAYLRNVRAITKER